MAREKNSQSRTTFQETSSRFKREVEGYVCGECMRTQAICCPLMVPGHAHPTAETDTLSFGEEMESIPFLHYESLLLPPSPSPSPLLSDTPLAFPHPQDTLTSSLFAVSLSCDPSPSHMMSHPFPVTPSGDGEALLRICSTPYLYSVTDFSQWNDRYANILGDIIPFLVRHPCIALSRLLCASSGGRDSGKGDYVIFRLPPTTSTELLLSSVEALNPRDSAAHLVALTTLFGGVSATPLAVISEQVQDAVTRWRHSHRLDVISRYVVSCVSILPPFLRPHLASVFTSLLRDVSSEMLSSHIRSPSEWASLYPAVDTLKTALSDGSLYERLFEMKIHPETLPIFSDTPQRITAKLQLDAPVSTVVPPSQSSLNESSSSTRMTTSTIMQASHSSPDSFPSFSTPSSISTHPNISDKFSSQSSLLQTHPKMSEPSSQTSFFSKSDAIALVSKIRKKYGFSSDGAKEKKENDKVSEDGREGRSDAVGGLGRALVRLSEELYSSTLRFVDETLQNADDNEYDDDVVPAVTIVVTKDVMAVYCNEKGFTDKDVEGTVFL
jgi:hypothetical protein